MQTLLLTISASLIQRLALATEPSDTAIRLGSRDSATEAFNPGTRERFFIGNH